MCSFHFFVREGPVITNPFKNLKGLLQGWKNSLGLWIQEQLHQKYTGMFTDLLRTLQRAEELEVGLSRLSAFLLKAIMISVLQHFLYWVLWSQHDYRLSSLNKVRCHKKSWKLWCEEQTGPPCPPPKNPKPHTLCAELLKPKNCLLCTNFLTSPCSSWYVIALTCYSIFIDTEFAHE